MYFRTAAGYCLINVFCVSSIGRGCVLIIGRLLYCYAKEKTDYFDFVVLCKQVLSSKPLFVLINSYTTGLQAGVIANVLSLIFGSDNVEADEIGLKSKEGIVLPCGNSGFKIWK